MCYTTISMAVTNQSPGLTRHMWLMEIYSVLRSPKVLWFRDELPTVALNIVKLFLSNLKTRSLLLSMTKTILF